MGGIGLAEVSLMPLASYGTAGCTRPGSQSVTSRWSTRPARQRYFGLRRQNRLQTAAAFRQGGKMRTRKNAPCCRAWRLLAAFAGATWAAGALAIEPTATVIEFYNATLNHYFITAYPEEAAMLDAGTSIKGWTRTGVSWNAWANAGDDP